MRQEILRVENVSKTKDDIIYLDNINFHIYKGEIMGLLPLNNHGKDELIQLIYQNNAIDFGRIYFNGELVNSYEYSNMSTNRVYIIDKNTRLVEDLNIIDNIYVLNNTFDQYIVRQTKIKGEVDKLLKELGLNIRTDQLISQLSIFERVIIELIKAATIGSQLIILNEISSFLGVDELIEFQNLLKYYIKEGLSFLYMGNHHEEVFKICHRACLFENGRVVKLIQGKDFSDKIMAPYIIDFDSSKEINEESDKANFEFKKITSNNLNEISFYVRRGECITILDIDNRGIQDIAQILRGQLVPKSGNMMIDREEIHKINIHSLIGNKLVVIPENPVEEFIFYSMNYMENLTFLLDQKFKTNVVNKRIYKAIKEEYRGIVGNDVDADNLRELDRKSLYKLVYHRILLFNPRVVFIIHPFSNADMYLRSEIIKLINRLKENGIAIVILAVNISDTLFISDKLLLMEEGRILRRFGRESFFKV